MGSCWQPESRVSQAMSTGGRGGDVEGCPTSGYCGRGCRCCGAEGSYVSTEKEPKCRRLLAGHEWTVMLLVGAWPCGWGPQWAGTTDRVGCQGGVGRWPRSGRGGALAHVVLSLSREHKRQVSTASHLFPCPHLSTYYCGLKTTSSPLSSTSASCTRQVS